MCSHHWLARCIVLIIMNNSSLPGTSGDNMNEVPVYQSESESETEITVTKKQKKTKDWIFLKQFSNEEDALNFVNSECIWSRNYTRATEDCQKRFYRCNKVKRREAAMRRGGFICYLLMMTIR
ncbi:hypothetical protein ACJJTC_014707 [Scirpophaga incertulas]